MREPIPFPSFLPFISPRRNQKINFNLTLLNSGKDRLVEPAVLVRESDWLVHRSSEQASRMLYNEIAIGI